MDMCNKYYVALLEGLHRRQLIEILPKLILKSTTTCCGYIDMYLHVQVYIIFMQIFAVSDLIHTELKYSTTRERTRHMYK